MSDKLCTLMERLNIIKKIKRKNYNYETRYTTYISGLIYTLYWNDNVWWCTIIGHRMNCTNGEMKRNVVMKKNWVCIRND